jgi:hypothetical protein
MATGIPTYDELKVRIEPGAEGAYRVLAFGPDGSTASGSFVAPFSDLELDNFVLRVGLPRRKVRSPGASQMEEAKRFGTRLFDALVQDEVRDAYLRARGAANAHDRGLRVTLQLTNVPELMEIPWEFLYERPRFLSQSIYTPVVRSLDLKSVHPPQHVRLPLRILGVVSSPNDSEALDAAAERARLEQALSSLIADGRVELIWLERATMRELNRTVAAPDHLHVIHYIGHGAYDRQAEGGLIVLEDERGEAHHVSGEELGSVLGDERSLGLAVLNACEGARTSHVDPFSGVASSLVECGVPAVIGMQFEVTDEAAIAFAEQLYSALADGFPVDAALAQARRAIFAGGHGIEFGTPVLFLRSGATRLFEIDAAAPRPAAVAPPPAPEPQPQREPEPEPAPPPAPVAPAGPPPIPVELVADQLGSFTRWYLRKALKKLPSLLEPGEVVQVVTSGELGGTMGTDVLTLLTDRRLLALAARDDQDVKVRVSDISAVELEVKLGSPRLTVTHGGQTTRIATLDTEPGNLIGALLRERISPARGGS